MIQLNCIVFFFARQYISINSQVSAIIMVKSYLHGQQKNTEEAEKLRGATLIDFKISITLGPNKHGLVTYIQVNVYIRNTLSWLNGG